ncbi:5-methylcytosine-specific restriction enzyme B [Polystyrenella longa]|uniref:5-methylcytosine-specific restriction enzyme B n=1 Tax=Polystyrenella longa TaxID=2528007 RepID=A0A518CTR5_9PLAN|nr:AAA family ATPase [Polystyrenella longa]QDU82613.1 5-methylcytosine-specific restriction enzyme B [Polystyrenella longa]
MLTEDQKKHILEKYNELTGKGALPTQEEYEKNYRHFRDRFAPERLAALDGEELLNVMHDSKTQDSLVYWLEFKKDEEFNNRLFGGIGGGSAMKFRLFRRKETGTWQGANQSGKPKDITLEEAIYIARQNRDQLLAGCKLLEALPKDDASDEVFLELQKRIDEQLPDVAHLAWAHKYYSIIYPDKVDNYHSIEWEHYMLLRMLQLPPEGNGRFLCAGRFISAAQEVGISMKYLTATLYEVYGDRYRYWRVGTRNDKTNTSHWEMMEKNDYVAIGWPELGDLSWLEPKKETRERLLNELQKAFPDKSERSIKISSSQIRKFILQMSEGDLVVAADGQQVLGIGKVTGGYQYQPGLEFPNQRPVEWLNLEKWTMPQKKEGLMSTVRELKNHKENLREIERHIQKAPTIIEPDNRILRRIQSVLERKSQVILYGPPGTGKTYWAMMAARDLAAKSTYGKRLHELNDAEKGVIDGNEQTAGQARICCFHPAYGYEDFLEGFRPTTINGQVNFELRDGVFKAICKEAIQNSERNYYLIVDEINRGDIPRIFGELLTTLEKDKRGKKIILPVSQERFAVPPNVYLIGTMNTADRSISLLDSALRRRFGFIEMMPDGSVLAEMAIRGLPLRAWFEALNDRIRKHAGRDARNLQIGHSYLMQGGNPLKDFASLKRAIRDDIIPLLEEYCYEDFSTLREILGKQLVDENEQQIKHELFDDGQEENLIAALLDPCPDIMSSTEAVISEQSEEENDDLEDDDSTDAETSAE